uniref:NADH-ubiquinone oxidoreductase chain 2 n=1 Tax=Macrohyliota sp. 1 MJ-2020 TaxID=2762520 RepID=A0A7G7MU70_9CUCU|nr:NADH dehydrogenase subunit 2 [Macrohyliota sp. 1 MJ-2020]
MFNLYKIIFFIFLIFGTFITISSYSWFSMWIGLEINLLSIIPLISSTKNIYSSESAMKYFITQAMASTIILFSIIMLSNMNEFIPMNLNYFLSLMMNSAILMKMGAAPFHFWFPEMMDGLNWMNALLILTWQKIAPMIIFMYNYNSSMFIIIVIIFSSMISGIMGLNNTSMRKIMTYSSINHIAWMIASMMFNQLIWMIYFICYTLISLNLIYIFHIKNIFSLNQLFNSLNNNKMIKLFFFLNFLSLGGLPPFLGFFPKWLTINYLILNNFMMISMILIVFSLISLFMYLRISFSTLIMFSLENLILKNQFKNSIIFLLNFFNLIALIFCTQIFNYI